MVDLELIANLNAEIEALRKQLKIKEAKLAALKKKITDRCGHCNVAFRILESTKEGECMRSNP